MSDDDFDEETFAAYENELYGEKRDSDSDVESEVEDALYSQVHHSFSLPDHEDNPEDEKDESEPGSAVQESSIVDSGKPSIIIISDDDDDGNGVNTTNIYYVIDDVSQNELEESSPEHSQENWDLIDKDMEDEIKGKRGAARYYAPNTGNPHKRCRNCNEKGHLARDCPIPKKISCVLCGTPGHIRTRCPNQLCFNCFQPGHRSFECQEFRVRWTDQCRRCYQNGHHSNTCADIWRQYHRTTVAGIPPVRAEKPKDSTRPVYCYNCSASGHYGYECPEERPLESVSFSTVQYIVRYDGHLDRPFVKTPRIDDQNRTHDRHKESRNKAVDRDKEYRDGTFDRDKEYRNRTVDREKEYINRSVDREKEFRNRTVDREQEEYRTRTHDRTPSYNQDIEDYCRTLNREKEDFRNRTHDRDNERTPSKESRKRIHDQDEDSTIEHSKRRKSWPSKWRPKGEGYCDYIAGRVKDGSIARGTGIVENEIEFGDFRIEDVEVPPIGFRIDDMPQQGSKKKKRKKKKTHTEELPFLVTFESRKERKRKGWKNNETRTVEYCNNQSLQDQPSASRTVELINPRKGRVSDSLMRIVDDWEKINEKQAKGNHKSSHETSTKHMKQHTLSMPSRQQHTWLPASIKDHQRPVPGYSRQKDSSSGQNVHKRSNDFRNPKPNFMHDFQGNKWPNKKANQSGRGFRSKKKYYTL